MKEIKAKKLEILIHPHEKLRQVCSDVKNIRSDEIQQLIYDMIKTMKSADGLGLAAPQVGKSLSILLTNDGMEVNIFINPIILYRSLKKVVMEEGCLSIPNVYGTVRRAEYVWAIYKDRNGHLRFGKITGLKARILQHEVDHLKGVLFIDKNRILQITSGQEFLDKYEGGI